MTLHVELLEAAGMAVLTRPESWMPAVWADLARVSRDLDLEADVRVREIHLRWPWFLHLARTIAHLQAEYGFRATYGEGALARLRTYASESAAVKAWREGHGRKGALLDAGALDAALEYRGWNNERRVLTSEQSRDTLRAMALENGAIFSVPGAGKTTVALAVHISALPERTPLLVVAPKNAFPAWDEALDECLVDPQPHFVRLVGGREAVRRLLSQRPERAIVSYGQLVRAQDVVVDYMTRGPVHLVLDESHRIKAGHETQTGAAALALSPFAFRRDILSGTPMPFDVADLAAQFDFLWPGQGLGDQIVASDTPGAVVRPFYVRTVKNELGLLDPIVDYPSVTMSDPQRLLYGLMRDDVLRQAASQGRQQQLMPGMRVSVMRMLQVAIDPQAAVQGLIRAGLQDGGRDDLFREVCRLTVEEDISPRMQAVEQQARDVTAAGNKVVIWAPFVHSIERLQARLEDLGALALHGGVEAGDEDEVDTREWVVKQFHDDPGRMVLVANPAAGGEGISLHHVCHHAIYLGRTYNAAHYLQSRDRIHRLGLEPGAVTRVTVYEIAAPAGLGSIDMSVRRRLGAKIDAMSDVLNDPDLKRLSMESATADPTLDDDFTTQDMLDLIEELRGRGVAVA